MKHVISINDFRKEEIFDQILVGCESWVEHAKDRKISNCPEKKATFAFFEPSTRTRGSYMEAARLLGWSSDVIIGEEATALSKKESMANAGRMLAIQGADVLVMRTKIEGAQRFIAEILEEENFETSVQNGGDGTNQHPTQTFLDLLTIRRFQGRLDDLKIGFMGDLKYGRTVHSLLCALAHRENISITLVSPPETALPKQYKNLFPGEITESESLEPLCDCDIIYLTRIQEERFTLDPMALQRISEKYRIDKKILKTLKQGVMIMHPMPYVTEITPDIRREKQIIIDKQAWCGIPTRMYTLNEGYKNRKEISLPQINQESKIDTILELSLEEYFKRKSATQTVNRYFMPITNGTVIDHIPQGLGLKIRGFLLGSGGSIKGVKHTIEDVPSKKHQVKDVLVLENSFLPNELMAIISSFAPMVTFNIVGNENFQKVKIKAPSIITGIGKCPIKNCITNNDPEANTKFTHSNSNLKCHYCEKEFDREEVI